MKWVSETMEVDGVKLGVRQHGDGAPLVILYGDQLETPVPPFDDAMAKHFRAVVPSLPGVNQSELPDWIDTMEDLAFLGLDLVEGLDVGPVDVIGHGFGGWVAAEMAVRAYQQIRRLALIDSVGHQGFRSHRARRAGCLCLHRPGGRRAGVARPGRGHGAPMAGHGGSGGRRAAHAAAQPPVGAEVRLASLHVQSQAHAAAGPGAGRDSRVLG